MIQPLKVMLCAAWVAPIDAPPMPQAGLVFADGRIIAVGPLATLRREHPDATVCDAGNAVVLPGLINAHTHLELTDADRGDPPAHGFSDWLLGMVQRGNRTTPEQTVAAVRHGIQQCLRFGVTTVGDISRHCPITRPCLADSPLRAVSYGEVAAMGQHRQQLQPMLNQAADASAATARLRVGISPHAPYSTEPAAYQQCLQLAMQRHLPLTTHLAESPDEALFLAQHRGRLRDLWTALGAWDEHVPRFPGGPIRFAQALGLLDYPLALLAHVNYCDDAEMQLLAAGQASVVYCPRTHGWFGHPPHRWREMLARGVNLAIGTDSCASSPDLNLVDDLRLLHLLFPQVKPSTLWEMTTRRAARAMGMESLCGTLTPAKQADATVFAAQSDDPLREILETAVLPSQVWIAGRRAG